MAAGAGPDMLFAIPDVAPILKGIGALSSVEDFVAELDAKHDFVDSAVEAYSYLGGVWAVPPYNMTMYLWCRPSDPRRRASRCPLSGVSAHGTDRGD